VALPIGQVDAVPPIEVLDAYNSIANGGVFVEPKLVRGYVYADGTVKATPRAPSASLSPSVAATMNTMLQQVVSRRHRHERHHPRLQRGRQDGHRLDARARSRTSDGRATTTPASSASPPPTTRYCR
jgi:cell division protein FtsI/penicillin-binding protein 2